MSNNCGWGAVTVGQLKEVLKNLPDDMPVGYQRIEDIYFEKHHWSDCSKLLTWEWPIQNEYVAVFSAYKHPDDYVFVLNAHY